MMILALQSAFTQSIQQSWQHMFQLPLPVLEKLLRPVIVFLVLVGLLRLFGKRELAQLNPFDLVVLLSLSNTVQNAIIGDDNSVTGGVIGAFALLAINWLVATSSSPIPTLFEHLGLGEPLFLADPTWAKILVCVFKVWISFPFMMMMSSAALASVAFVIATLGLRIYLRYITGTGYTYGALATPIAFLLFA